MSDSPNGAATALTLWKASRALQECAHASIKHTGLGLTDFGILEALLHKGRLPVNTLGRILNLTSGSITTAVDRLAARELVERKDDPGDRRVRIVELTDAGRTLIEPAYAAHSEDLDRMVAVLTPEERTTLVALLRKLGMAAAHNP